VVCLLKVDPGAWTWLLRRASSDQDLTRIIGVGRWVDRTATE